MYYIFLWHFLLTSYPQEPWRYFQIASCICLSTPGYTHETIHIFHQLFFITLSVTDVVCDFVMFYYFVCYFHVLHIFSLLLLYLFYWNLAVFITCYWNIKLTYLLQKTEVEQISERQRLKGVCSNPEEPVVEAVKTDCSRLDFVEGTKRIYCYHHISYIIAAFIVRLLLGRT